MASVRVKYDPEADAAFVYIGDDIPPGGAPESHVCDLEVKNAAVILLLSPDRRLVGLEVLGASRLLPSEVLREGT